MKNGFLWFGTGLVFLLFLFPFAVLGFFKGFLDAYMATFVVMSERIKVWDILYRIREQEKAARKLRLN